VSCESFHNRYKYLKKKRFKQISSHIEGCSIVFIFSIKKGSGLKQPAKEIETRAYVCPEQEKGTTFVIISF